MTNLNKIAGRLTGGAIGAVALLTRVGAQGNPKIPNSPLPGGKPTGVPGNFETATTTITTIYNFIIAIAAAIFVVLLVIGGVQYLAGAGNEETTTKAKKLLVDAIIGLVIVLAAWGLGNYVINKFFSSELL